jgi:hypothetical protein
MERFESTRSYGASELDTLPELDFPATGPASGSDSGQQIPLQTTRCCRKLWKNGPWRSSPWCFPRHLEIIYEVNRCFLDEVRTKYSGFQNSAHWTQMSIINTDHASLTFLGHCLWPCPNKKTYKDDESIRET